MNFAFIFPGQGSQSLGMLADLSKQYPIIQQLFQQASDELGVDLWHICQNDADKLNQTQYTQPAMLCAGVAIYQILKQQSAIQAHYLAGHSLGEWSALVAGGYLDFVEGVILVKQRAELMQNAMPIGQGAMAAILGLDDKQVIEVCKNINDGIVEAVNFNAPSQVVIAGQTQAVNRACEKLKEQGAKRTVILPVSVPSHCSLMNNAADEFSKIIQQASWKMGEIPIVHNVNAQISSDIEHIKQYLVAQLKSSVHWTQSIQFMASQGIDTFIECGPGKILSGLGRRIDKTLNYYGVYDHNSLETMMEVLKNEK